MGDHDTEPFDRYAYDQGTEIPDKTWDQIDRYAREDVAHTLSWVPEESSRGRFATVVGLLEVLRSETHGKRKNKTLQEHDPDAWTLLRLRKFPLERLRDQLRSDEEVVTMFRRAREKALRRAIRSDAQHRAFKRFLLSDKFAAELKGLGKTRGAERLKVQLLRLMSLSPKLAEEVSTELAGRQLAADPLSMLQTLPQAESEAAVLRSLDWIAELDRDQKTQLGFHPPQETKAATVVKQTADLHKYLATPAKRQQLARILASVMNSPDLGRAMRQMSAPSALATIRMHNVEGAGFLEAFTKNAGVGQGVTAFFNIVALASVRETFPLVGDDGNIRWKQLAASSSGALGVGSTMEVMAKLCHDSLGPQVAKLFSEEFKAGAIYSKTSALGSVAAGSKKFAHFCDALGMFGDAISLPFAIKAVFEERANQDTVGFAMSIVGALSAAGSFAFSVCAVVGISVCPPVALAVGFIGIAASFVDSKYGESRLTGDLKKRLDQLGVFEDETKCYNDCATETYSKRRTTGIFGTGRSYQTTERREVAYSRYESNVRGMTLDRQIHLINYFVEGKTKAAQETKVLEIFEEARRDPAGFVRLIEATDAGRIAYELDDSSQAATLMGWTILAYNAVGKKPGSAFDDQFLFFCKKHDWQTLMSFFRNVSGWHIVDQKAFKAIAPKTIDAGAWALMRDFTGPGGEMALSWLLSLASYEQLDYMVQAGKHDFVKRVRKELDEQPWENFHKRLQSPRASKSTQWYATVYR